MTIEYAGGTYSDDDRNRMAALEASSQPRGMTQQDAECAYYAKHGTPWDVQAMDYYQWRDRCGR
jgi:uncharacterized protein with LGFP repeats